ncbi:hypothetical protein LTR56_001879 [Elasticomyces elasticus]|nr:hypothetical protein LTR56_001879 [Elasticomyces elasticus]KAK3668770.1 hypothetical protein LTR22_000250 [Elasticomyces elasticus]KAK4930610.1 hypothetical protein LTR49_003024 [Elasticomyces elasticus]KAK5757929.1 hypothetical protein LTS12_011968 [Elasticomyces elasticus]
MGLNQGAEGIVAQVAALSLVGTEVKDNLASLVKQRDLLAAENALLRSENNRYESQARKPERNPYVAVLVDGDGYIFNDQYITDRSAGGQKAAQDLDQAVKKDLRSLDLEHCQVMVRVYADLVGLSKALARAGLAGAEKRSLAPFAADFTRSNETFDFCDAGELKEGADFKIRALFRHFIEDARCKQVYFAGCHDTGYVAELTQHAASRDRITLVKHYAFHYHFSNLSMREVSLGEVFRTTLLDFDRMGAKPRKPTGTSAIDQALAEGEETLAGPDRPACAYWPLGICKLGKACHFRHDKQVAKEPDTSFEETSATQARKVNAMAKVESASEGEVTEGVSRSPDMDDMSPGSRSIAVARDQPPAIKTAEQAAIQQSLSTASHAAPVVSAQTVETKEQRTEREIAEMEAASALEEAREQAWQEKKRLAAEKRKVRELSTANLNLRQLEPKAEQDEERRTGKRRISVSD